jgi:hypothetical protein
LGDILDVNKPLYRVSYDVKETVFGKLRAAILDRLTPYLNRG